jgi:hypothetical protein
VSSSVVLYEVVWVVSSDCDICGVVTKPLEGDRPTTRDGCVGLNEENLLVYHLVSKNGLNGTKKINVLRKP